MNICEMTLGMVDKIVRGEEMEKEKEYLRSIADNKVALMQHRINKVFKGNRRRKNPNRVGLCREKQRNLYIFGIFECNIYFFDQK